MLERHGIISSPEGLINSSALPFVCGGGLDVDMLELDNSAVFDEALDQGSAVNMKT